MTTNLDYALMAGSAYRTSRSLENLFPAPQGWSVFFPVPDPSTASVFPVSAGFEAISFQSGTEIVISYAGTYSKSNADLQADINLGLGLGSDQLNQAIEYYLQVKATNQGASITLTGHSLGGGLAALVGVFFGVSATVFDEAPFAQTALFQAQNLKAYLVGKLDGQGNRLYSDTLLEPLTAYIAQKEAFGASPTLIPNANLIQNIAVQGEFLSALPKHIATTVESISNTSPGASAKDYLHSIALLSAFLQSQNTAVAGQRLNEVTVKLPDLVRMLFDPKLFGFESDDVNNRTLVDHLVRHESGVRDPVSGTTEIPADAMVTRFTSDLWKLAQNGGLTLRDSNPGNADLNEVSKTLMAFAMQKYYEETSASAGYQEELFGLVAGGLQFDMADVSDQFVTAFQNNDKLNLSVAKGFEQYFKNYLNSNNNFTPDEQRLIQTILPYMRDWYVQAGADGMTATDTFNRGAFMLGGSDNDAFVGGTQADLLVGNAGADTLNGGAGNDTLLGGTGTDSYNFTGSDFGKDVIVDSDGQGQIKINGVVLGQANASGANQWSTPSSSGTEATLKVLDDARSSTGKVLRITLNGDSANSVTINHFNLTQALSQDPNSTGYLGIKLNPQRQLALQESTGSNVWADADFTLANLAGQASSVIEGTAKTFTLYLNQAALEGETITLALSDLGGQFKAILGDGDSFLSVAANETHWRIAV